MNGLIGAVQPVLKELHFRKRRHAFNRTVEPDGLIHVISFQMGAFWSSPYGRFTINLGVRLPGVAEPGFDAPTDRAGRFINEYNCHLRTRVGELLPQHQDTWWPLDTPADELAATITSAITGYALPWLARFSRWDDPLRQLEQAPADPNWFAPPARLTVMEMHLARGNHAAAQQAFKEHLDAYLARHGHPGHLDFLAEIARRNSFNIDIPATAQRVQP
jgi:Domain of unknown function (DUF4304)